MFKRVDKRRKRQEEEEELGINEEMKEAMGLNDTDSDESASSEDEDEQSEDGSDVGEEQEAFESQEGDNEEGSEDEGEDDEGSDEEDGSDEELAISIGDALLKPVRASPDGDYSTCVFCTSAILKHEAMVRVHLESKAHKRRMEKAVELSMPLSLDTDLSVLLKKLDARTVATPKPKLAVKDVVMKEASPKKGEEGLSNRALKRIKKQQQIAAKRKMVKEVKARKAAKKQVADGGGDAETEVEVEEHTSVNADKGKKSGEPKAAGDRSKKRKHGAEQVDSARPQKSKAKKAGEEAATEKVRSKRLDEGKAKRPIAEPALRAETAKGKGKAKAEEDVAVAPAVAPVAPSPRSALKAKKRKAPTENESAIAEPKKRKLDKPGPERAPRKESKLDSKAIKIRAKA